MLGYYPSHLSTPPPIDPYEALDHTLSLLASVGRPGTYRGQWRDQVERSLITLKALHLCAHGWHRRRAVHFAPEHLGGVRNWDYRFCWFRDATFTLYALMMAGYHDEASAWRDWLVRAVAGDPAQMQIMYGAGGERNIVGDRDPLASGLRRFAPRAHRQWLPRSNVNSTFTARCSTRCTPRAALGHWRRRARVGHRARALAVPRDPLARA